jgi:uncharacterized protein YhbP (UPF0306 family)
MDKKILNYINSNKVFTMATAMNNQPYCANCFYVFDENNYTLIFLSDDTTRHISEALSNELVAGTITTEVTSVAKIQGIQFEGVFVNPSIEQADDFYKIYHEKFPFARAKPSPIWGIEITSIKMTDNTLGFGKKTIWSK